MVIRVLDTLDRMAERACQVLVFIGSIALVTLIPIFGWMVFGRYVLNATPTWVEQVALLLMAVMTFPVAAAGVFRETHLEITFFRDWVPPRLAAAMRLVSFGLLAAFGGAMASAGLALTRFGWNSLIPLLGIPTGVRSIPLALCGAFVCLFASLHAVRALVALLPASWRAPATVSDWSAG